MEKGVTVDDTIEHKQKETLAKKTHNEIDSLVTAIKNAFAGISKAHLQWVRSEVNRIRYEKGSVSIQDINQRILEQSKKLGGKDFAKVVPGLEKALEKNNLTEQIFELGLREAILEAKEKGGN